MRRRELTFLICIKSFPESIESVELGLHRHLLVSRSSKSAPRNQALAKLSSRPLRVVVIGGGPAGGSAAETLAKGGVETFLIERKLDNSKPCSGAIPVCLYGRGVRSPARRHRQKSNEDEDPSNIAVDIGRTLKPHEYIGMVQREVLNAYLRKRASSFGATIINGLFLKMDKPKDGISPYVLHYDGNSATGKATTLEVNAVIGTEGANSRVAHTKRE